MGTIWRTILIYMGYWKILHVWRFVGRVGIFSFMSMKMKTLMATNSCRGQIEIFQRIVPHTAIAGTIVLLYYPHWRVTLTRLEIG